MARPVALSIKDALDEFGLTSVSDLDDKELRRRYKQLALKHHPDKAKAQGVGEAEATAKFKRISEAHDLLRIKLPSLTNVLQAKISKLIPDSRSERLASAKAAAARNGDEQVILVDCQDVLQSLGGQSSEEGGHSADVRQQLKYVFVWLNASLPACLIYMFLPIDLMEYIASGSGQDDEQAFLDSIIPALAGDRLGFKVVQFAAVNNKKGVPTRIISNDAYTACVANREVTPWWILRHTVKYSFSPDGHFVCPQLPQPSAAALGTWATSPPGSTDNDDLWDPGDAMLVGDSNDEDGKHVFGEGDISEGSKDNDDLWDPGDAVLVGDSNDEDGKRVFGDDVSEGSKDNDDLWDPGDAVLVGDSNDAERTHVFGEGHANEGSDNASDTVGDQVEGECDEAKNEFDGAEEGIDHEFPEDWAEAEEQAETGTNEGFPSEWNEKAEVEVEPDDVEAEARGRGATGSLCNADTGTTEAVIATAADRKQTAEEPLEQRATEPTERTAGSADRRRAKRVKRARVHRAQDRAREENGAVALPIAEGAKLVLTKAKKATIYDSGSWDNIGTIQRSDTVVACGPPFEVDGYRMVPIDCKGMLGCVESKYVELAVYAKQDAASSKNNPGMELLTDSEEEFVASQLYDDQREELARTVDSFAAGGEAVLNFPPTLSSLERKFVHLRAAAHGLLHESSGTGVSRHIQVSRRGARRVPELLIDE